MSRANLTVETGAFTQRVLIEGRRAVGLVYRKGGTEITVKARREVLLSAGSVQSPQLLELSGIGNGDVLKSAGVDVAHHLPGVGENLRDHLHVRLGFETRLNITLNTILRSPLLKAKMGARWLFLGRGLMSTSSATSMAIARSNPDLPRPDIKMQLHQLSMASSHYGGQYQGQLHRRAHGAGPASRFFHRLLLPAPRVAGLGAHTQSKGR